MGCAVYGFSVHPVIPVGESNRVEKPGLSRVAHNHKNAGSNPAPVTTFKAMEHVLKLIGLCDHSLNRLRGLWMEAPLVDKAHWMKQVDAALDERLQLMGERDQLNPIGAA